MMIRAVVKAKEISGAFFFLIVEREGKRLKLVVSEGEYSRASIDAEVEWNDPEVR